MLARSATTQAYSYIAHTLHICQVGQSSLNSVKHRAGLQPHLENIHSAQVHDSN